MPLPINIEDLLLKRKIESNWVEPDKISILSYVGPDRSISWDAIQKAERLKSRRYRNCRLGDYLKELRLSERRSTGIPTIHDELRKNGSDLAKIETDIPIATLTEIITKLSYILLKMPDYQYSKKTGGYVLTEKGKKLLESKF